MMFRGKCVDLKIKEGRDANGEEEVNRDEEGSGEEEEEEEADLRIKLANDMTLAACINVYKHNAWQYFALFCNVLFILTYNLALSSLFTISCLVMLLVELWLCAVFPLFLLSCVCVRVVVFVMFT